MIVCEFMAAAGAVLIGGENTAMAVSAACRHLPGALRTEVKVALDVCAAGWARRGRWQAQQEIDDRADSTRQHQTDKHPESSAHGASRRICTDIADHEAVNSSQQSP